ncbi:transcriptional regulator with XRE-family HTH domain [Weissella uvarum]|uniref:helix-turn-helix domain-containing protein n=1 Tax=Weissella uvarum TaxID=1479233 RepID=UPI001961766F|nr:helix-turn-helix transcriptional regulator [Weissella uvarum]MBM7617033.1 transcriptional regulator with XRE-family HTH domain [Weissella uvarum]MCM0595331.1 helix-turn-helix transcriptional regulator [Weissella uvarum]
MNNLATLRELFKLSSQTVADATGLSIDQLHAFENESQQPNIAEWQKLAEYYADQYHVEQTQAELVEPIHFRLSVDYLMNIGLTINDLLAMQWYFANTRPELGPLSIALFNPADHHEIERITTDLHHVIDEFAAYLLLNHDGTLNQFIDERNNNHVSDWRLLLYKRADNYVDVTDIVSYFVDLPDLTKI